MFYLVGRQSISNYLSITASSMLEEGKTKQQVANFIYKQDLPSKKIFVVLDTITTVVFVALSILKFTGVLPNVSLGGAIAMLSIGSLNAILLAICARGNKNVKAPQTANKNVIDLAAIIDYRLRDY